MTYVMSDIHGCFREFKKMLSLIEFRQDDTLFVLGDLVDGGPDSMPLLLDIMMRTNVFCLLGNHDYMALKCLSKLTVDPSALDEEDLADFKAWMDKGGAPTLAAFRELDAEEQEMVLDFLNELELYETVEVEEKKYVLVHSGFLHFAPDRAFDDYLPEELIESREDYSAQYFERIYTVAGHVPTMHLRKDKKPSVFKDGTNIFVDCGASHEEGRLGCLCLDTGEEFYVK